MPVTSQFSLKNSFFLVQVNECQRLSEGVSENLRLCGDAVISPSQMESDPIIIDDWSVEDAEISEFANS